ncbi:Homoserine O-acetyltransferase [Minicystis rosea]|nr:Homoserine O-acetyltransferase [Minicystis rosea]
MPIIGPVATLALLAAGCAHANVPSSVAPAPVAGLALEHRDVVLRDHRFLDGETLPALRIHVSTAGTPHRDAHGKIDNAVLLLHWTSASAEALQTPAYVEALYGPGKPLDAQRHYLVFLDNVGHGRSSKPSDGLRAAFPHYGYRDMVAVQHAIVRETLGIERLHAIVGMSMGGMHGYLWAETYPDEVEGVMAVVAQPTRISGRNLLWRRIVSRTIRAEPEYRGGAYDHPPRGLLEAMPLFRMMLDGAPHLEATLPDRAAADGFIGRAVEQARTLDANDLLYSLESSADYDPEPDLGRIRARVLSLMFADDAFNPVELGVMERLMPRIANGRLVVQPGTRSSFGHFTQAHPEQWATHVATFLRDLEGGTR